jgi:hypothetical protein
MPLLVIYSVNIIIKSWRNIKTGERFYPFAIRSRFWIYSKIYGQEKLEDYKSNFDKNRKRELVAVGGIIYGVISIIIYMYLSYESIRILWY